MDRINVTDRFDGAAHWANLDQADRDAIGAAALEWMAAENVQSRGYEEGGPLTQPRERIGMAAVEICRGIIQDAFVSAIPQEAIEAVDGAPRIPSLLGMVCQACRCSEQVACPGGCGWARDNLCTACSSPARHGAAA